MIPRFVHRLSHALGRQRQHAKDRSLHLAVPLDAPIDTSSSAQVDTAPSHPPPLRSVVKPISPQQKMHQMKCDYLMGALSASRPEPTRVWAHYVDIISTSNSSATNSPPLSLEVHQRVLRACVPPAPEIRAMATRSLPRRLRMQGNLWAAAPYAYEDRMQTVVHAMRASGWKPTTSDYNFVLEQFAAVGYHVGALRVMKELTDQGLQPTFRTYSLFLESIAHRLNLPCRMSARPRLHKQASDLCLYALSDMQRHGLPITSVNFDLAIRVLKETLDEDAFVWLMKVAYRIDLHFPDRLPILTPEQQLKEPKPEFFTANPHSVQPLSTDALNTTIAVLGRMGNVSRLVQTFEVLTAPLPSDAAPAHFSSSFEEDDDDRWGSAPAPSSSLQTLAHAPPNTTTYNTLIRSLSHMRHAVLARHYLVEAIRTGENTDRALRSQCYTLPPHRVTAPHFAVNRGTLLPVYGLANRDKNIVLMRWVRNMCYRVIRRKKADMVFYTSYLQGDISAPTSHATDGRAGKVEDGSERTQLSTAAKALESPPPQRGFDVRLHIALLERDIAEISDLHQRIERTIERTHMRVKERLGRRVWDAKDIYVRDLDTRTLVSKESWRSNVNFRVPSPQAPRSPSREWDWRRR